MSTISIQSDSFAIHGEALTAPIIPEPAHPEPGSDHIDGPDLLAARGWTDQDLQLAQSYGHPKVSGWRVAQSGRGSVPVYSRQQIARWEAGLRAVAALLPKARRG